MSKVSTVESSPPSTDFSNNINTFNPLPPLVINNTVGINTSNSSLSYPNLPPPPLPGLNQGNSIPGIGETRLPAVSSFPIPTVTHSNRSPRNLISNLSQATEEYRTNNFNLPTYTGLPSISLTNINKSNESNDNTDIGNESNGSEESNDNTYIDDGEEQISREGINDNTEIDEINNDIGVGNINNIGDDNKSSEHDEGNSENSNEMYETNEKTETDPFIKTIPNYLKNSESHTVSEQTDGDVIIDIMDIDTESNEKDDLGLDDVDTDTNDNNTSDNNSNDSDIEEALRDLEMRINDSGAERDELEGERNIFRKPLPQPPPTPIRSTVQTVSPIRSPRDTTPIFANGEPIDRDSIPHIPLMSVSDSNNRDSIPRIPNIQGRMVNLPRRNQSRLSRPSSPVKNSPETTSTPHNFLSTNPISPTISPASPDINVKIEDMDRNSEENIRPPAMQNFAMPLSTSQVMNNNNTISDMMDGPNVPISPIRTPDHTVPREISPRSLETPDYMFESPKTPVKSSPPIPIRTPPVPPPRSITRQLPSSPTDINTNNNNNTTVQRNPKRPRVRQRSLPSNTNMNNNNDNMNNNNNVRPPQRRAARRIHRQPTQTNTGNTQSRPRRRRAQGTAPQPRQTARRSRTIPRPITTTTRATNPTAPQDVMPSFSSMSPSEQARWHADFNVKFATLRKIFPDYDIPYFDESVGLDIKWEHYNRYSKQIKIDQSVTSYKVYLIIFHGMIEAFCVKLLGMDFLGYTTQQMNMIANYELMLIELGEKSYVGGGSSWPVEVRIVLMSLFNAIVFFAIKLLSSYLPGIGSVIQNIVNSFLTNQDPQEYLQRAQEAGEEGLPDINQGSGFDIGSIINGLGNVFGGGGNNNTGNGRSRTRASRRPTYTE
jgi:hypothetical protein